MAIEIQAMTPLLEVFDMARSLRFYCDVLGFQVVTTDANTTAPDHNWVWLKRDDIHLMLNTAYEYGKRPPAPDPRRVAAHRDTAFFFSATDVDAVFTDLRAKGVKVKPPKVASYGMKQLYLRDPDGFELCFQCPAERPVSAPAG